MKENSRLKVPVVVGFVLVFLCLDRQPKRRKETERARRSKRRTERKAAKKKLRARRRRAWLSERESNFAKPKKTIESEEYIWRFLNFEAEIKIKIQKQTKD